MQLAGLRLRTSIVKDPQIIKQRIDCSQDTQLKLRLIPDKAQSGLPSVVVGP